jgi:predicted RNA-binding Zn ribbon-like protein
MVTRSQPGYVWDFCGGHAAIDFTNTVNSRGGEPGEHFNVYGDVLSWAEARGVLTRAQTQRLAAAAAREPGRARLALAELVALREAIYRVLAAAAAGRRAAAADLAALNGAVAAAFAHARLAAHARAFTLEFDAPSADSLTQPIAAPIARAAAALLTTDAVTHVRRCADASCAWLFLDTTRSGTRRWCDMKVCGNRSKVRRFRARE